MGLSCCMACTQPEMVHERRTCIVEKLPTTAWPSGLVPPHDTTCRGLRAGSLCYWPAARSRRQNRVRTEQAFQMDGRRGQNDAAVCSPDCAAGRARHLALISTGETARSAPFLCTGTTRRRHLADALGVVGSNLQGHTGAQAQTRNMRACEVQSGDEGQGGLHVAAARCLRLSSAATCQQNLNGP